MSSGWFKAARSTEAIELIAKNNDAFILAYIIAYRARYNDEFNRHDLNLGEALLGDYRQYGMTEKRYRVAKMLLEKHKFAAFKGTNRGTVASLCDSRLFVILGEQQGEQQDIPRANQGRTKGDYQEIEEEKKDKIRFKKPSLSEVKTEFASRGLHGDIADRFISYYESNGWMIGRNKMKSWTHAVNTWVKNNNKSYQQELPNPLTHQTNNDILKGSL